MRYFDDEFGKSMAGSDFDSSLFRLDALGVDGGDSYGCLNDANWDMHFIFYVIDKFVEQVKLQSGPVYLIVQDHQFGVNLQPTGLARWVKAFGRFCEFHHSEVDLQGNLKLAAHAVKGLHPRVFTHPLEFSVYHDRPNAEVINEMVDWIRRLSRDPLFKGDERRRNAKSRWQFESSMSYIDSLYAKYRRLLVLRFDLSYKTRCTVVQAKLDFKQLLDDRRLNQGIPPSMVGYLARIEYGIDKGVHLHVIFFFNGDLSWKDEWLVERIGKYWCESITGGDGMYFNCNRKKREYKDCGIGMIRRDDFCMRQNLIAVVRYLVKKDKYLSIAPNLGRVFFRGEV